MTTLFPEEVKCSVCGAASTCMSIGSTNTIGPPDLDLRPAEMARSNITYWVHRCPTCGYCAGDLAEKRKGARALVKSKEYIEQLNNPDYPELANSFLCKAMLDEKDGDLRSATWSLIHAAWVCDDAEMPEQASACRRRAAGMLEVLEGYGLKMTEQEGSEVALLVDLLRRSGEMGRAKDVVMLKRGSIEHGPVRAILDFQLNLIEENDTACHTVDEAFRGDDVSSNGDAFRADDVSSDGEEFPAGE